jgi:hypothetical protein
VFSRTPYSERTLEIIAIDTLRRHESLLPKRPAPIPIDRLVEEMFGFNETYERLERGVLGEIYFGIEERPIAIRLARRLGNLRSSARGLEQERRGTLAHECGHGIAHSKLFADSLRRERAPLLRGFADGQTHIACRERDLAAGSVRPAANSAAEIWLEWEANYLMGALLLPRHLVLQLLGPWIAGASDGIAPRYLPPRRQQTAIVTMSNTFDVAFDLAARRLTVLIPASRHPDFFEPAAIRSVRPQRGARPRSPQRRRNEKAKIWSR